LSTELFEVLLQFLEAQVQPANQGCELFLLLIAQGGENLIGKFLADGADSL